AAVRVRLLLVAVPALFHPSRHHLDLHSFPTRRSSDLTASGSATARPATLRSIAALASASSTSAYQSSIGIETKTGPRGASEARRSEEHTSELQSLTNLVCHRLLEQKNHNTPM